MRSFDLIVDNSTDNRVRFEYIEIQCQERHFDFLIEMLKNDKEVLGIRLFNDEKHTIGCCYWYGQAKVQSFAKGNPVILLKNNRYMHCSANSLPISDIHKHSNQTKTRVRK